MSVKHIDIGEFQKIGFLQEANWLFFHPHGLALEITTINGRDGEKAFSLLTLLDKELWALSALIDVERRRRREGEGTADLDALTRRIELAKRYELGDGYISGVWDYREDPEGIFYGSWDQEAAEKASRVAAQRERHREARASLFRQDALPGSHASPSDIEPVGWVAPPGTFDDEPAESVSS